MAVVSRQQTAIVAGVAGVLLILWLMSQPTQQISTVPHTHHQTSTASSYVPQLQTKGHKCDAFYPQSPGCLPLPPAAAQKIEFTSALPFGCLVRTGTSPPFMISTVIPSTDSFVSAEIKANGFWDFHVLRAVAAVIGNRCEGQHKPLVFDVGANLGFVGFYAAALGCRVHAFEPQTQLQPFIQSSVFVNGFENIYTLHQNIVSDTDTPLYMMNPGGGNIGGASVCGGPSDGCHRVDSVRLDDMINVADPVLLMKIDVEGHEPHVLKSALRSFADGRIKNIVMEFSAKFYGAEASRDILRMMHENGYAVFHIPFAYAPSFTEGRDQLAELRDLPYPTEAGLSRLPFLHLIPPAELDQYADRVANAQDERQEGFTDVLFHKLSVSHR